MFSLLLFYIYTKSFLLVEEFNIEYLYGIYVVCAFFYGDLWFYFFVLLSKIEIVRSLMVFMWYVLFCSDLFKYCVLSVSILDVENENTSAFSQKSFQKCNFHPSFFPKGSNVFTHHLSIKVLLIISNLFLSGIWPP